MALKVGTIKYLNAKPLVHGLETGSIKHNFDLVTDVPSNIAASLASGEIGLGLIPSIEYSRIRETKPLQVVPEIAITSSGTVKSVELFFNEGLENISTVAVDTSSRTSVVLLQIILREKYNIHPKLIPMAPDLEQMLRRADAAMIIGDRALDLYPEQETRLDLGEEWYDLTDGLPFVYAFWAGHLGVLEPDQINMLQAAKRYGENHTAEIVSAYVAESQPPLSEDQYVNYLKQNVRFDLDDDCVKGLNEFYSYAFYYNIIREVPNLNFF